MVPFVILWAAIGMASGLTQIGELSLVVVQVARSSGMVEENVFSTVIAASLISISLNVLIVRGTFGWLDQKVSGKNQVKLEEQRGSWFRRGKAIGCQGA
jgi:Kef-type K+ transport system membrane component KefB